MDIVAFFEAIPRLLEANASLVLVVAGVFTGIIATVIGGGMFFSLPVFQFLYPGVPAGVLVGNIKVGSLIRGIGSALSTFRLIDFRHTIRISIVAFVGTIIGASIVADLDQRWLFFITVASVLVAEFSPRLARYVTERTFAIASFLIGVYTGFLGAGTGILLVALLRLKHAADTDIGKVKANARFAETFLGISAVAVHFFHGNLVPALWIPWSIGALIGGVIGGVVLVRISGLSGPLQKLILRLGFGFAILVSALAFVR